MFHGHVIERRDGRLLRCGGPALCADCQFEQDMVGVHAPECQMLTEPPDGFPFESFSCNCDRVAPPEEAA